jgi:glyoxylase I family protein
VTGRSRFLYWLGMLRRVHHIAIICSDYQRSLRFYTETLGLRLIA